MQLAVYLSVLVFNLVPRIETLNWRRFLPVPRENCHLNLKNCQKLDFFFLNCQKLPLVIFKKNENFWQFFWKKWQVFGNFWQSNGNFPEDQVTTTRLSVSKQQNQFLETVLHATTIRESRARHFWQKMRFCNFAQIMLV